LSQPQIKPLLLKHPGHSLALILAAH